MAVIEKNTHIITEAGKALLSHCASNRAYTPLSAEMYIQAFIENRQNPLFLDSAKAIPNFVQRFFELIDSCHDSNLLKELFIAITGLQAQGCHISREHLFDCEHLIEFFQACLHREYGILYFKDRVFDQNDIFHLHLNSIHQLHLNEHQNIDLHKLYEDRIPELLNKMEADGFEIVNKHPTHLSNSDKPCVLFCSGTNCKIKEVLLIDEQNLDPYAKQFESKIRSRIALEGLEKLTESIILEELQYFVDKIFEKGSTAEIESKIQVLLKENLSDFRKYHDKSNETYYVVPLSVFVESTLGVCRHRALFDAYLLDTIIKKGYILGTVSISAEAYTTENHAWVKFASKTSEQQPLPTVYLVDTYNELYLSIEEHKIINPDEHNSLLSEYGFKPLYRMLDRASQFFQNIDDCLPTSTANQDANIIFSE